MTTLELIDIVLTKLGEPSTIAGPEVEAVLPQALHHFAHQVAESSNRELLRKDFSVTVTSGIGDLTAAFTDAEPLLLEYIHCAYIVGSGDTTPWQFLPDRVQLGLARPRMFKYFTVDQSTLRTRNTDGSLTSLNATATITGNYVPTITNVPLLLKDDLADIVISVLQPVQPEPAGA